jgi:hypothetical protein
VAVVSRRQQVSGPTALKVLGWLARVGPAPAETVAVAFGWTERRACSARPNSSRTAGYRGKR